MKKILSAAAVLGLLCAGCGGSGAGLSAGDPAPTLSLSTGALDLHAMQGAASETGTCTVSVYPVADWTASSSAPAWCTVTPSGASGTVLTVTANPAPLPNGATFATVTVSAPNLPDQTLNVTFTVHEWTLSQNTASFNAVETSTTTQSVAVTVTTDPAQAWTASSSETWCTVNPGGSSGGTLTVTVDPTGLAINTYTATVTVSSAGMVDETIDVTLVIEPPSGIFPDDFTMYFSLQEGYTPAATQSTTVNVYSPVEDWTAVDDQTWCVVTAGGASGTDLTVTVATGLTYGLYSATVTVSSSSHPSAIIDVQVSVSHAGNWTQMPSGTTVWLRGIHGTSGSNVYCVGGNFEDPGPPLIPSESVILHYDGSSWTEMTSPTIEVLMDVWCVDANNIFAVGDEGTILRCDGSTWTVMATTTTVMLEAVWGSSATDVHAAACSGYFYYNGTSWSGDLGNVGCVYGMHGTGPNNIWSGGSSGRRNFFNGTTWQMQAALDIYTRTLEDVWTLPSGDAFFTGRGRSPDEPRSPFVHYDGSTWTIDDIDYAGTSQDCRLFGVWAASPTDVWIVGERNTPAAIFHFDGLVVQPVANWPLSDLTWNRLSGIWGASATDIFVCGDNGWILHFGP